LAAKCALIGIVSKKYLDRAIEDNSVVAVKNIDRYRGLDDRIAGRMMRFEHIVDDFKEFLYSFGIGSCVAFPHAKRGIGANAIDPKVILTNKQIIKINNVFEEEFLRFNYLSL
jgi:hypothetical protein